MEPWVETVHAIPGRIRLRVSELRNKPEASAAAARAVATVPGVAAVRVHPFTASFLVTYDDGRTDGEAIASALSAAVGARSVLPIGQRPPVVRRTGKLPVSKIGRALMQAFHDANDDLLRSTDGGIDLGVLATSAFAALGAAEVVANRKLASPGWFNLAWWGFQTFLFAEGAADLREGELSPHTE